MPVRVCPLIGRRRPGLSSFPKKTNRQVDHDHYYYDFKDLLKCHLVVSLARPNCRTDPSSGQEVMRRKREK